MLEQILVAAIVLVAASYATWALLPGPLRLRLARRLRAWARQPGRPAWLGRLAAGAERAARARLSGCGDCSAAQPPSSSPPEDRPER